MFRLCRVLLKYVNSYYSSMAAVHVLFCSQNLSMCNRTGATSTMQKQKDLIELIVLFSTRLGLACDNPRRSIYTEEKPKVVAAFLGDRIYSISCRASYFAPGLYVERIKGSVSRDFRPPIFS